MKRSKQVEGESSGSKMEEEGLASQNRDWAHLPHLPLHLISEKFKSIMDYARFRAVCSPWRLASPSKPRHLPPQLPWLMIPYNDNQTDDDGMRLFYDIWESKMLKIHLPETMGKTCCASYCGWLLLVADKGSELFLLNPITRARVDRPPLNPFIYRWADDKDVRHMRYPLLPRIDSLFQTPSGNYAITKVIFSSNLTDPDCLIIVFFMKVLGIFCCRVGDCQWTEIGLLPKLNGEPADVAYHNGHFYLLTRVAIIDLSKRKCAYVFEPPEFRREDKYFLVGKSGLYLVVISLSGGEQEEQEDCVERVPKQRVIMYRLSEPESWMDYRVTDTSDTTIFCGGNYQYLAVCADEWDSLEGDSMYLQYKCSALTRYGNYRNGNEGCYNILFSRLNGDESQPVVNDIGENPGVWPPLPAMWFQPSFV